MNIAKIQKKLKLTYGDSIVASAENNCIRLRGQVKTWEEAVAACQLCAKKGSKIHVVSDISVEGLKIPETKSPSLRDKSLEGKSPEVLIIGGGVVGCALARELSKKSLRVLLIDKECDVALHASSRNDGMVHPGIDILPGLLKRGLNTRGNRMYGKLCGELNVPFERCGQFLCFNKAAMRPLLYLTWPVWLAKGAGSTKVFGKKALKRAEPQIDPGVKCALFFKTGGRVCPYGLTIALAENAVENGVQLSLETAALSMEVADGQIKSVITNRGTIYPKLVVNAAGVFSEEIAKMAGDRFFSIHPRRGTNVILDKKARKNIRTIYARLGTQAKAAHSKGGGVVGTVDGNVLVGPDAVETFEKENFATNPRSVSNIMEKQKSAAPWLSQGQVITYFTGVRAATYEEDFIVEKGRSTKNIVHAAGIQSPGLTAAPAIAERLAEFVGDFFPGAKANKSFNPIRRPIVHIAALPLEKRSEYIAQNPNYGEIICRCEEVSRGEIVDALHRPVPCRTVDGVKRRTRPGMGRCQGGFCSPLVVKIISDELGIDQSDVCKSGEGSELLLGEKGVRP